MTIIPFRRADHVATDAMADTEAASSIPPWPVAPHSTETHMGTDPIEGAGAVVVPVLVALFGVVGFALFVALQ
jgi:hypothetical protein